LQWKGGQHNALLHSPWYDETMRAGKHSLTVSRLSFWVCDVILLPCQNLTYRCYFEFPMVCDHDKYTIGHAIFNAWLVAKLLHASVTDDLHVTFKQTECPLNSKAMIRYYHSIQRTRYWRVNCATLADIYMQSALCNKCFILHVGILIKAEFLKQFFNSQISTTAYHYLTHDY
jgi:hypothetical protein